MGVSNIVTMKDDGELGPRMRALTERQRAFVMAVIEQPGITQGEAARLAGYSASSDVLLRKQGHFLAHDERIIAAIHETAGQRMRAQSLMAANVLVELLGSENETIALKAAGMLLDRVGFGAQQNININQHVTDNSGKAIMERIRALAQKHGLDEAKLLGKKAEPAVIEAEFAEVPPNG